jgi:hypothetical protein
MILKWFDASEAERFGQSLAQFFIKKIPADFENKTSKTMAKQLGAVDQMYLQIEQFKLKNSLNVYKKAKLGSAFKYELITAGYDPKLVDQVTKGLMLKL